MSLLTELSSSGTWLEPTPPAPIRPIIPPSDSPLRTHQDCSLGDVLPARAKQVRTLELDHQSGGKPCNQLAVALEDQELVLLRSTGAVEREGGRGQGQVKRERESSCCELGRGLGIRRPLPCFPTRWLCPYQLMRAYLGIRRPSTPYSVWYLPPPCPCTCLGGARKGDHESLLVLAPEETVAPLQRAKGRMTEYYLHIPDYPHIPDYLHIPGHLHSLLNSPCSSPQPSS